MNDRSDAVRRLIRKSEEELEEARLQVWFYERELKNPKTVGRIVAEERVELFGKRMGTIKTHISILHEYLKDVEKKH